MSGKGILSTLKNKVLWINILAMIIIVVILYALVFVWLGKYTHHGEQVQVPDVTHLNIAEAADLNLQPLGLSYEVIDSVYETSDKTITAGQIAEQTPKAGTSVKRGRKIYLTVRSGKPRLLMVPQYNGLSVRQVEMNLKNMGFVSDSVRYKPSETMSDLVVGLENNGVLVQPGDKFYKGEHFTVVAFKNTALESYTVVPNFIGLSLDSAQVLIYDNNFALGQLNYDVKPLNNDDSKSYLIYYQDPQVNHSVKSGMRVNLWLSKDPNKEYKHEDKSDEDFF